MVRALKPIVGGESCQEHHIGYAVSGHLHVEMTDCASLEVIGGDAFEIPPGHDSWVIGDEPWVSIDWAGRRLFAKSPKEISDRIFTTAVFTDLCGSTQMLIRLGDSKWRLLLAEHNEAVRAQIDRFGGREVKTTGDGFCEGSRSTQQHAFWAWRSRTKSLSRPPSAICSQAPGWHLQTGESSSYADSMDAAVWRRWSARHSL